MCDVTPLKYLFSFSAPLARIFSVPLVLHSALYRGHCWRPKDDQRIVYTVILAVGHIEPRDILIDGYLPVRPNQNMELGFYHRWHVSLRIMR